MFSYLYLYIKNIIVVTICITLMLAAPKLVFAQNVSDIDAITAYRAFISDYLENNELLVLCTASPFDIDGDDILELVCCFTSFEGEYPKSFYKIFSIERDMVIEKFYLEESEVVDANGYGRFPKHLTFVTTSKPKASLLLVEVAVLPRVELINLTGAPRKIGMIFYEFDTSAERYTTLKIGEVLGDWDYNPFQKPEQIVEAVRKEYYLKGQKVSRSDFFDLLGYNYELNMNDSFSRVYFSSPLSKPLPDHITRVMKLRETSLKLGNPFIKCTYGEPISGEQGQNQSFFITKYIPSPWKELSIGPAPIFLMINGSFVISHDVIEIDKSVYLPLRILSEKTGKTVSWDKKTQAVSITGDGLSIKLTVDSPKALVNGREIDMAEPMILVDGSCYIGYEFVVEYWGVDCGFHVQDIMPYPERYITIENKNNGNMYLSVDEALSIVKATILELKDPHFTRGTKIVDDLMYSKNFGRYYVIAIRGMEYSILINKYSGEIFTLYFGIHSGLPF